MSAAIDIARQEWEEEHRRLEAAAGDSALYERLLAQVGALTGELRRRLGGTFTLAELAELHGRAESWAREAVAERAPAPGWPRTLAIVQGAAFHLYSRGARDFAP